jgi:hypothetical protein
MEDIYPLKEVKTRRELLSFNSGPLKNKENKVEKQKRSIEVYLLKTTMIFYNFQLEFPVLLSTL